MTATTTAGADAVMAAMTITGAAEIGTVPTTAVTVAATIATGMITAATTIGEEAMVAGAGNLQ